MKNLKLILVLFAMAGGAIFYLNNKNNNVKPIEKSNQTKIECKEGEKFHSATSRCIEIKEFAIFNYWVEKCDDENRDTEKCKKNASSTRDEYRQFLKERGKECLVAEKQCPEGKKWNCDAKVCWSDLEQFIFYTSWKGCVDRALGGNDAKNKAKDEAAVREAQELCVEQSGAPGLSYCSILFGDKHCLTTDLKKCPEEGMLYLPRYKGCTFYKEHQWIVEKIAECHYKGNGSAEEAEECFKQYDEAVLEEARKNNLFVK